MWHTNSGVAFGVLGHLEVRGHLGEVVLRGSRQVTVLALLLVRANRVVPVNEIIDRLWPEQPPETARAQVLTVVSALRRLLGDHTVPAERRLLLTRSPGYLLRVADGQLDVQRFESLLHRVDREQLVDEEAASVLQEALDLWRGPALADVPAPFAVAEAHRLGELRLSTIERLNQIALDRGRYAELIPTLTELVAEYPLRERLRGQLMTALHAVGRTATALEVFRNGRRLLVEEFGIEPGVALRRIEREILAQPPGPVFRQVAVPVEDPESSLVVVERPDPLPELAAVEAVNIPYGQATAVRPAQLPADIGDFTGRSTEMAVLTAMLTGGARQPHRTAVPVVVVTGRPGVGKSTLVRHVGHCLRTEFPDGQLHVELHDAQGGPVDAPTALTGMLTALGVAADAVPEDLEARAGLYRSVTADRRILVVLDDAADAAQVRPLLPGGAGCAVLVTSRGPLTDLASARTLRLGVPSAAEALSLLEAVVGVDRVTAEPVAARQVVELCDRMPLAVRLAGARLAARPHWTCARLAARLADENARLDELDAGDVSVRTTLAEGLRTLDPATERAVQLMALLDVPTFTVAVAAAVWETSAVMAEDRIDRLVVRDLLQVVGSVGLPGECYRFPDLVRLVLRERAARSPYGPDRSVAVERARRSRMGPGPTVGRRSGDLVANVSGKPVPACTSVPVTPALGAAYRRVVA